MKRLIFAIVVVLPLSMVLPALAFDPAPFTEHFSVPASGFVAWGDYDNDGDLDLVAGCSNIDRQAHIIRNEPTGVFVEVQTLPCGHNIHGNSDPWADYDGDGDLDLALPARDASFIYRNDGGTFVADTRTSLPTQFSGGAWFQWGDLDNDGDPDLVLVGVNSSRVFINDGTGLLTSIAHPIPTRDNHGADLGDYDNDGDLDLVVVGGTPGGGPPSRFDLLIFRNDGAGTFSLEANLADRAGDTRWVDYDLDGLLDIFVVGGTDGVSDVELWKQGPIGTFTPDTAQPALDAYEALGPSVNQGVSDWGDYDNDGDPDLIISSPLISGGCLTRTYRNDPTGSLVEDASTGLHNVSSCFLFPGWGDFDGDLDLDLVVIGLARISPSLLRVFANEPPVLPVEIDIKPGSDPNSWPCRKANDDLPVAILSTDSFDATTVDADSVRFGKTGTEAAEVHEKKDKAKRHVEDKNGDGLLDMVFHFRFGDTGFSCDDIPAGEKSVTLDAKLTGTADGAVIEGGDSLRLVKE